MRPAGSGGGADPGSAPSPAPLSLLRRVVFGVGAGLVFVLSAGGVWVSLTGKHGKLGPIAQVDARVHAPAVPAPGPADWPRVGPDDAYRHVRLSGTFLNDRETLVQAVTELGGGFWVLTPLRRPDGTLVLVNRGFVPEGKQDPKTRPQGQPSGVVEITGALRWPEPRSSFTPADAPEKGLWFARDPASMAKAKHWDISAPFYVDQEAPQAPGGLPKAGPLKAAMPNRHLEYAVTWYGLGLVILVAAVFFIRARRREA